MSALGHKQTFAVQNGMSALPCIATAKAEFPQKSCPLYPRKRTCAVQLEMSAMGQKRRQPYSIISLARERSEGGTVRTSGLAGDALQSTFPLNCCVASAEFPLPQASG